MKKTHLMHRHAAMPLRLSLIASCTCRQPGSRRWHALMQQPQLNNYLE
jgi:hypothetical protein